jgi:hypothetical protein
LYADDMADLIAKQAAENERLRGALVSLAEDSGKALRALDKYNEERGEAIIGKCLIDLAKAEHAALQALKGQTQ